MEYFWWNQNLKLLTFSESFFSRNFQDGVVGLGIVAAMTDETQLNNLFVFLRHQDPPSPPENSDGLLRNHTCAVSRSGDNRNNCRTLVLNFF
ncbi:hypothetical protein GQ457_16G005680 [Hibiscus cannabinus]